MPWAKAWGPVPKRWKVVKTTGEPIYVPYANFGAGSTAKLDCENYAIGLNSGLSSHMGLGMTPPQKPPKPGQARPLGLTNSWILVADDAPESNDFGEIAP